MTHEPLLQDIKDIILEQFEQRPSWRAAAKAAGMTVRELKGHVAADPAFKKEVDLAIDAANTTVDETFFDLGVEGVSTPVISNGKPVMVIDEKTGDTVPLMERRVITKYGGMYAKAHLDKYGDRQKLDIVSPGLVFAPATLDFEDLGKELVGLAKKAQEIGES